MATEQDDVKDLELSIVIPVRDEAPNIAPLADELAEALEGRRYEALFVDDGSRDETWSRLAEAHERDPRIRGLRLKQASGKAAAYAAGFTEARGRVVATLDGDLQDDPRDLLRLETELRAGHDLVVGWKQSGKSSPLTFVLSRLFNALIRWATKSRLHDLNCPLRVMRPEVARSLELRADLHRYIPLLAQSKGYRVTELPVANRPRQHGESKYRSTKYWSSAVAFLGMGLYLRFGHRPMALFGSLGLTALLLGLAIDAWVAVSFLFLGGNIDDDLPTLVLGIALILIGTQFLSLGLLAEIISRKLAFLSGDDGAVAERL